VNYNTVKDSFYFTDENEEKELKGWKNTAYSYSNIQYKIEHDWKMCYLARTQGSNAAFIEWVFNIDGKKVLEKIEIKFTSACYEDGQIDLSLVVNQKDKEKINLNKNQSMIQNPNFICSNRDDFYELNSKENVQINSIKLRADLSHGKGDCSWQHTQLFRASLNDSNQNLFKIIFHFK
jgi:peptide-N4-(N-acetyl-beta-glucosaminyl)asparagine amidase